MKKSIKRLLLAGISTLLFVSTFLAVIPQTQTIVYADTGKAVVLVYNGAALNINGAQASSIYFGTYNQSSDGGSGYNADPIKWRVLQNSGDQLFLLADKNLDCKKYNDDDTSVTWETCTLRTWLNGTSSGNFYNDAFDSKEQGAIASTTVTNPNNPDYSTSGGNDTTDKVFLLSIAEVTNTVYGFTDTISVLIRV
ncbi:MAG: DUF6273 domain-containing protein [Lachnospiraceae bacterium]|nr:DUF6273 domain-containing protein [Lachnospiraceae bacterium]